LLALRFSCGTEGTLWKDGVPFQGFDPYRDLAFLWPAAKGGERFDLLVEGACNLPLGISTFWWDHPELQTRWREPQPGRLESAELVVGRRSGVALRASVGFSAAFDARAS
jgi:hypothetical protein